MKSAISIQCLPKVDLPRQEVYKLVDQAIAVVDRSGLPYIVGPMETTVEGELDRLLELVKSMHETLLEAGAGKVFSYVKIVSGDDLGSSEEKIAKYRKQGH